MTRDDVFGLIDGERDYQDAMWRRNGEPNPLTVGEFLLLLEEYVARARAVWANEEKPTPLTLDLIRKVAGVAVNCMEQHGAPPRNTQ